LETSGLNRECYGTPLPLPFRIKDTSFFMSSTIKFSSWRSKIIPITIHMRFEMRKLAHIWFASELLAFPHQLLYRQCSFFMSLSSTEWTAEPLGTRVLLRHSLVLPHKDNKNVTVYVLPETSIFLQLSGDCANAMKEDAFCITFYRKHFLQLPILPRLQS
jgi:hypothetical protein